MNIHYFQHVPFEGIGSIGDWAIKPGNKVTATRFYEDHRLPFIDLFDFLIIMGGPMGAYDDHKYPWMVHEKKLIEKAIEKNKLVLGICLGAQIVADVLGAKVYPHKYKEIGWFPVQVTSDGKQSPYFKNAPDRFPVLHWHGDTFDLPAGAQHLAKSEVCEHQAFSVGKNVLGLQFHLEANAETVSQFLEGAEEELQPSPYVQSAEQILAGASEEVIIKNNSIIGGMLTELTSGIIPVK